ncbi:hypothetical protein XAP6164_2180013 [Xanthomonas phaseoli pv. phaseoli]|nr:hypothetical protein XAP6164_2180013 [Xanthomonas phaseoli pv. phaseoli]
MRAGARNRAGATRTGRLRARCPLPPGGARAICEPVSVGQLATGRLGRVEQAGSGPFGVIHERVAVALEAEDHLVAGALGIVRRIGLVPGQQRGQQAHVGGRGRGLHDLAAVVGELQVRLGLAAGCIGAAFVADRHVHHSARHIALAPAPHLEGAAVAVRRADPVGIARVTPAAAATAVVDLGHPLAAAAGAGGIGLVAAVCVEAGVGQVQHVGVGVGRVRQAAVVGGAAEAQRVGPGVLAVVGESAAGAGPVADLGVAAVAVGVQDAAAVAGILVGHFQDGPGAGAAAAVRVHGVAANGGVERAAQLAGAGGVHPRVVAGGAAAGGGHSEGDGLVGGRAQAAGIADGACGDGQRAALAADQGSVGGQREAGAAGRVCQCHVAGAGAAQRKRAAAQRHRFAEAHGQIAGGREAGGALRRCGAADGGRTGAATVAAGEGLAAVAGAEGLRRRAGPAEVGRGGAGAGQLQRTADRGAVALAHRQVLAGHAGRRCR